jgi:hypothetical protein
MSMLHFLFTCMEGDKSAKRMFLKCHILYIDEGAAVYGWTPEESQKHRKLIQTTCEQYKMKFSILPMESVFDIKSEVSLEQNLAGVNAELMESSVFKTVHAGLPID